MTNSLASIDIPAVLKRLGGDQELLEEIFMIFLDTSPRLVERLRDVITNFDSPLTVRLMHELKGAAANIGAEPVRLAALTCEQCVQHGDREQTLAAFARLCEEYDRLCGELRDYRSAGNS